MAKNTLGYGSLARNYVTYDPSGGSEDTTKGTGTASTTSQHKCKSSLAMVYWWNDHGGCLAASAYLRPMFSLILAAVAVAMLFS